MPIAFVNILPSVSGSHTFLTISGVVKPVRSIDTCFNSFSDWAVCIVTVLFNLIVGTLQKHTMFSSILGKYLVRIRLQLSNQFECNWPLLHSMMGLCFASISF